MNKYDEIMEHIHVTDEMRDRVLDGTVRYFMRERRRRKMRRLYTAGVAAAAVVLVMGVGVFRHPGADSIGIPGGNTGETEMVAGGFYVTDCASVQELEDIVGFPVPVLSKLPFAVKETAYTAIGDDLAQIIYYGEDGDTELILRKSPGIGDNSGDYNTYENETELEIGGNAVSLKGNAARWYLACWHDKEYAYSLSYSAGCDEAAIRELAAEAMGD